MAARLRRRPNAAPPHQLYTGPLHHPPHSPRALLLPLSTSTTPQALSKKCSPESGDWAASAAQAAEAGASRALRAILSCHGGDAACVRLCVSVGTALAQVGRSGELLSDGSVAAVTGALAELRRGMAEGGGGGSGGGSGSQLNSNVSSYANLTTATMERTVTKMAASALAALSRQSSDAGSAVLSAADVFDGDIKRNASKLYRGTSRSSLLARVFLSLLRDLTPVAFFGYLP